MGLPPETPAMASGMVRLQASCLDVRESIANAGMCDSFGIVQLSGKPGEMRKHCEVSIIELEAGGCSGVFVSFVTSGVLIAEGETYIDMTSLLLIYTPVLASQLIVDRDRAPWSC